MAVEDYSRTGLKGIPGLNARREPTMEDFLKVSGIGVGGSEMNQQNRPMMDEAVGNELGRLGVGNSTYDQDIQTMSEAQNIENFRGENQSGLLQLTNGIIKMGTTAGTTFLDGTVGLALGVVQGLTNALSDDPNKSFIEGLWNNDFNKAMAEIQENMETIAPNYYTDEQRESSWNSAANLLSANFLGDKLLKNMGFTIGAMATMAVPGVNMGWLGKGVQTAVKGLGATRQTAESAGLITKYLAGGLVSANGEASIEAINAVREGQKEAYLRLDNLRDNAVADAKMQYQQDIASGMDETEARNKYLETAQSIDNQYKEGKGQVDAYLNDAGNTVWALNTAVLTASNLAQFSKVIKGGYNTQKNLLNSNIKRMIGEAEAGSAREFGQAIGRGEKAALVNAEINPASKEGAREIALRSLRNIAAEGTEELTQNIISNAGKIEAQAKLNEWAADKYRTDKDKYSLYANSINPEVTADMTDYVTAMSKAWVDNFGSFSSPGWEEFVLGGITGGMGTVSVRTDKTGKAKLGWQGGVIEAMDEVKDRYADTQAYVDLINKQLGDPKFKERARHAMVSMALTNDMDLALENNDISLFKNAELMSLVNDAIFHRNNETLDEYRGVLEGLSQNVSDDDIENIKGQLTDVSNGSTIYEGKTNDEIRSIIKDKSKSTLNKLDNALAVFDDEMNTHYNIFAEVNPLLADAAIYDLTTYRSLYDDLLRRKSELEQKQSEEGLNSEHYASDIKDVDLHIEAVKKLYDDAIADPDKYIKGLIDKSVKARKIENAKDDKKTVEWYQSAPNLQAAADALFYSILNKGNKDAVRILNEAIKGAEGNNKEMLQALKPFMAQIQGTENAVNEVVDSIFPNNPAIKGFITNLIDHAIQETAQSGADTGIIKSLHEAVADEINVFDDERTAKQFSPEQMLAVQTAILQIADKLESLKNVQEVEKPKPSKETQKPQTTVQSSTKTNEAPETGVEGEVEAEDDDEIEGLDLEEIPEEPEPEPTPRSSVSTGGNPPTTNVTSNKEENKEEVVKSLNERKDNLETSLKQSSEAVDNLKKEESATPEQIRNAEAQAAQVSQELEDVKKEIEEQENNEDTLSELDIPQLPATTQIPTAERSLKGVTYEIYRKDTLNRTGKATPVSLEYQKSIDKFLKETRELFGSNVDISHMVNDGLGYLLETQGEDKGKIRVKYLKGKDSGGHILPYIYLVTELTGDMKTRADKLTRESLMPELSANRITIGNKEYMVVGVVYTGWESNKADMAVQRLAGQRDMLNSYLDNKFRGDDKFVISDKDNLIYDINNGEIVREIGNEKGDRDINILLNNKDRNPHKLTPKTIKWVVVEGTNENGVDTYHMKFIGVRPSDRIHALVDKQVPGEVFIYIPATDGSYIPQHVSKTSWTERGKVKEDSLLWKNLQSTMKDLCDPSKTLADRVKSISQLRDYLQFAGREANIYLEINPEDRSYNTIKAVKESPTGEITQYDEIIDFNKNITQEDAMTVLNGMLDFTNPMFNIKVRELSKNPQLYIDAGLIQINTQKLGTINATPYLYPIDGDLNPVFSFQVDKGKGTYNRKRSNTKTKYTFNNGRSKKDIEFWYDGENFYISENSHTPIISNVQEYSDVLAIKSGNAKEITLINNGKQFNYYVVEDSRVYYAKDWDVISKSTDKTTKMVLDSMSSNNAEFNKQQAKKEIVNKIDEKPESEIKSSEFKYPIGFRFNITNTKDGKTSVFVVTGAVQEEEGIKYNVAMESSKKPDGSYGFMRWTDESKVDAHVQKSGVPEGTNVTPSGNKLDVESKKEAKAEVQRKFNLNDGSGTVNITQQDRDNLKNSSNLAGELVNWIAELDDDVFDQYLAGLKTLGLSENATVNQIIETIGKKRGNPVNSLDDILSALNCSH